jgi:pyridoxine 5'-phosphate synthase PdxJ
VTSELPTESNQNNNELEIISKDEVLNSTDVDISEKIHESSLEVLPPESVTLLPQNTQENTFESKVDIESKKEGVETISSNHENTTSSILTNTDTMKTESDKSNHKESNGTIEILSQIESFNTSDTKAVEASFCNQTEIDRLIKEHNQSINELEIKHQLDLEQALTLQKQSFDIELNICKCTMQEQHEREMQQLLKSFDEERKTRCD